MRYLSGSLMAILAAATLASSALPASAVVIRENRGLAPRAGYVNSNGTIAFGTGFTVSHTGTGQYTITYPQSDFTYFPAMGVTAFGLNGGLPIANLNGVSCGNGKCKFMVGLYNSSNGSAMDNGFDFVIIEAK